MSAALPASPRASAIGLPASRAMISASGSTSAAHRSAARFRIWARSYPVSAAISCAPFTAAASVRSTSFASASGTVSIVSPE